MPPLADTNDQSQLLIKAKQLCNRFIFLCVSAWITYGGLITKQ